MVEFMQQGTTIMLEVFRKTKKLCRAIQNERHGMLTSGVVLLHDNVSAHSCSNSSTAGAFQLEVV
jgi:hypothetical protein